MLSSRPPLAFSNHRSSPVRCRGIWVSGRGSLSAFAFGGTDTYQGPFISLKEASYSLRRFQQRLGPCENLTVWVERTQVVLGPVSAPLSCPLPPSRTEGLPSRVLRVTGAKISGRVHTRAAPPP